MNVILELGFGLFALGYGIYTLFHRCKHPEKYEKLAKMQQTFGNRGGYIVHVISYTVLPIIIGIVFIGMSLISL